MLSRLYSAANSMAERPQTARLGHSVVPKASNFFAILSDLALAAN